jgi:hypothetical protein
MTNPDTGAAFNGKDPLVSNPVALSVAQPKPGVTVECSLQVDYTDATGAGAVCGQNLLISSCDLGCTSQDLEQVLLELDGGLHAQRATVEQAVRLLRSVTGNKKAGVKESKEAQALFTAGWTLVWSFPTVVQSCTNTTACVTISNAGFLSDYTATATELDSITDRVLRRVRALAKGRAKFLRSAKAIEKTADKRLAFSLTEVKDVPLTRSSCE